MMISFHFLLELYIYRLLCASKYTHRDEMDMRVLLHEMPWKQDHLLKVIEVRVCKGYTLEMRGSERSNWTTLAIYRQ